ncbi:MAG TPA: polysaccharide biosynthesis/export family protein [Pyrinomonadaceae bacterium]|nr:polysaccharide biosynthesis/export family protein [Pyrinomonadaceae bacterium]
MRLNLRAIINPSLVGLFLFCSVQYSSAQQGSVIPTGPGSPIGSGDPSPTKVQPATTDALYRIGPGDVLDVRVAREPELSRDSVRVDQAGMIRMPMLDTHIPAACLTETELAQNIAKLYRKYKTEPHVEVFVKEFQSQPVAVMGAVRAPAQFKLQRQVRLLELLTFAGGPAANAGQTVQIVHSGGASLCDKQSASETSDNDSSTFVSYLLDDTLRGKTDANPFVRPGDIVQVPEADQVFVLGNVLKPSAIPLIEPLTVSRAIAIAGGTAPSTKKDKIRIIRQVQGTTAKKEIYVDLTAIEKNKAEDVALLANDVVDVPISGTKSILRSLLGAVVPTVTQLPVRVIP